MKHLLFFLLLSFLCTNLFAAEISSSDIKKLAEINASHLWGDVSSYEPIPYYNLEDEIIAWRFNFSIGKEFYSKEDLSEICRNNYTQHNQKNIVDGSYGRMLVSADTNYPTFLEYSKCLSQEFTMGWKAEEIAEEFLANPVQLEKIYYLNRPNLWYCFKAGSEKVYVKLYPPLRVCDENEFRKFAAEAEHFCRRSDNSDSWGKYLSGEKTLTRDDYFIDNHEMVPYYDWSYGCSPTSATMALAYWDYISVFSMPNYSMLVRYHYQRYDTIQEGWDYQVPNLQRELAIAMETDTLVTGGTNQYDIASGTQYVTNNIHGYDFVCNGSFTGNFWNMVVNQTVVDRPCLVSEPGHTNCGIGYNTDSTHVAIHNTHDNTIDWIADDLIDGVIIITPGGGYGEGINLVHPRGDIGYNSDGGGETFLEGAVYEISWDDDNEYRGDVSIWLSTTGNGNFVEHAIVYDVPSNKGYDWVVPAGLTTNTARIGISLSDEWGTQLGMDGSLGNFIISPGGSIPLLDEDDSFVSNREPQYFRFYNNSISWSVVGVRRMVDSEDENWNIKLFSDTSFETELTGSYLSSYSPVDLVVIDGNHAPWQERGIKIYRPEGSGEARVEYEGGSDELFVGSNGPFDWLPAEDVVEMWDVHLLPGYYYIIMEPTVGGNANLDMAFFRFEDGILYGNRLDALAFSNYLGTDTSESISIEITEEDDYGLCVWGNDEYSKTYNIRIEQPGTWMGTESDYWYDEENWSGFAIPDNSTDVVIPAGTPYDIRLVDSGAGCKDMTIMPGARVEIYNCWLIVHNNIDIKGELEMSSDDAKMEVYNNITWHQGAIADIQGNDSEIWVRGYWYFKEGSSAQLNNGYVEFEEDETSEIICRSDSSWFNHLRNDKNTGYFLTNSNLSTKPLIINGDFINYSDSYFINYSLHTLTFRSNFDNETGAQFKCPNGTVRFEGTNQHINLNSGDYFNKLVIDGSVILDSGIKIEDDLVISSGEFVTDSYPIQIEGNWTDDVGFGGFTAGSGVVIFNGTGNQRINGENFAELRINKNNGELRFTTGITYCDELDWLDGTMRVNGGEFTALDMNSNSIYHDLFITEGALEIHKPAGWLDFDCNFTMEDGTFIIEGASLSDSYWAFNDDCNINISGGILDFQDTGIRICDDNLLLNSITGGLIKTTGDFTSERSNFDMLGGTLELYGDADVELDLTFGSSLCNLTINKTAIREGNTNKRHIIEKLERKTGDIIKRERSQNVVAINNLDINGDFTLMDGNFVAPTFIHITGDWANYIGLDFFDENGGTVSFTGDINSNLITSEKFYNLFINKDIPDNDFLFLEPGKTYKIDNVLQVYDGTLSVEEGTNIYLDTELRIEDGAVLELKGLDGNPVKIASASGSYSFQVKSGATIEAEWTEFENMNLSGIYVANGSTVNPDKAFNFCTFQNGTPPGTLLTIDNNQTLEVTGAMFPSDFVSRSSNVTKNFDHGNVIFYDAEGSFAGEDYDEDIYDRVDWMQRADLVIESVSWSDTDPYGGDLISCEVVVKNVGEGSSSSCFLDLYLNRPVAPEIQELGDTWAEIDPLTPGNSTIASFTDISCYTVMTWHCWLQIDTDDEVYELLETNNIWGPDNINWLPIPSVDDVIISRNVNRDTDIVISWLYPIPVSRFEIHGNEIPDFDTSAATLIDNTTSYSYQISLPADKYFYKVVAVRDSVERINPLKNNSLDRRK